MNDKIKQLKIQACKWASENAPSTEYENACDQKFAELIVKECLSVIEEMNPHDPERHIDDIFDEVDEHFGVEE